jgi:hypothetical protein
MARLRGLPTVLLGGLLALSCAGKNGAKPGATGGSDGATGGGPASGGVTTGGAPGTGGLTSSGGSSATGGAGAPDASAAGGSGGGPGKTTVVLFLIDGLQPAAARTAAANGAVNLKFVMDNGVVVQTAHSTSTAARTVLPDGSMPWGNATSGNVAVHTGTHLFEAGVPGMDDIFKAARDAGLKSVFSGGDANYSAFTSADFHYAAVVSDEQVVQQAITHLRNDKVRLLRLHLQRIRDDWTGPANVTDPGSAYLKHIVASDALLGQLRKALEDEGVWDSTYLVVTADHGMGQTSASAHVASSASSWDIFMAFYGPDLKKGATIPYAELPDVAVTAARFLGLRPLQGHTGATTLARKGPTGTVLTNLFLGAPADLPHPRWVEQYLKMNTFQSSGDDYGAYRRAMLELLK